jgi:DNA-directed RNA polymerase subunit K/omega
MGAPVLMKVSADVIDPVRIATAEFDKGLIPISVNRRNKVRFKWE